MRVLIIIILSELFLISNAQKSITFEKLRDELVNTSEPASISIYSSLLEQSSKLYMIDLISEHTLTEPPVIGLNGKIQITSDIITTSEERKLVIDSLYSNGFLESLYVRTDTIYTNVKFPNEYFKIDEPLVVVEILHNYDNNIMQTYLNVNSKEQVDELFEIICIVLSENQRKVFKQYRENIKRLGN